MRFRTTKSGYKFDKYLIYLAWGVILIGLFFICYINDFDFGHKLYYECQRDICPNPLLNSEWVEGENVCKINTIFGSKNCTSVCEGDWCYQEFLRRGEYGVKPIPYEDYFLAYSIAILAMAVYLNHRIHNKGKKFDLGLEDMYPRLFKWFKENENNKNNGNN